MMTTHKITRGVVRTGRQVSYLVKVIRTPYLKQYLLKTVEIRTWCPSTTLPSLVALYTWYTSSGEINSAVADQQL